MIGMHLADRLGPAVERRAALFYAPLLKDAGCSTQRRPHGGAVRRRRPAEARAPRSTGQHRATSSASPPARWRPAAPRAAPHAAPALRTLANGGVPAQRGPLRPRRRIVAMMGFRPPWPRRCAPSTSTGTAAAAPTASGATRSPWCRASRARPDGRRLHRRRRPAGGIDVVRARRGSWFDPRLADAFLATSPDDPLWLRLAPTTPTRCSATSSRRRRWRWPTRTASTASPRRSRRHRREVALHARALRGVSRLRRRHRRGARASTRALRELRRAALLHDIGKLGVSNTILDKTGSSPTRSSARSGSPPPHARDPEPHLGLRRVRRGRRRPPRAARRPRLPPRRGRRAPLAGGPHPRDRRRLRGAHRRPALPRADAAGAGPRDHAP